MSKTIQVVKVIDNDRVVVNAGSADGVEIGQKYLIYKLDDEIIDPDTNESLGRLEIPRGKGRVDYVQEKMAQVKSVRTRTRSKISQPTLVWALYGKTVEEEVIELPFDGPETGDLVKRID